MSNPSKAVEGVKLEEEEEIIRELCADNGLTYGRLAQEGLSCVRLEMFFSGYPKMIGLNNFPNLQVLCIVGQPIIQIQGLSAVPKLKELWISECQVQRIEGLSENKHLKHLYLYDNDIKKIENISHLAELEKLWLNNNEIKEIEGLQQLHYLKDLNLAENYIEKIGTSLSGLSYLEKLELSGNKIYSFKDLTNLTKLPALRELGLNSAQYRANPVALLCNYTTHILYHLPSLAQLDTYDISNKAIKDLAEATVMKKKMYYNMKVKTVYRQLAELQKKMNDLKDEYLSVPKERLQSLAYCTKQVECDIDELQETAAETDTNHDSGTESEKDYREQRAVEERNILEKYRKKLQALENRMLFWENKITELEHYYKEAMDRLRRATDVTVHRLTTELETGGNVRFEDGKPNDLWFTSCHDLVLSRFCAADYKEHGISGIKIHKITRVHNRILKNRFDDELAAIVDTDDCVIPTAKNNSYKKLLEYLFWIWDPDLPGGQNEPASVLENGFKESATYKQHGKEEAVPLTNSLSMADRFRMQQLYRLSRGKDFVDSCPYRYGQLVVAKVYIGKSVQAKENKLIVPENYPKCDSVMRPKLDHASKLGIGNQKPICECSSRQCEWFIFNHHLVMPEYVIDFEYITKTNPKSPFATCTSSYLINRDPEMVVPKEQLPSDDEVLQMEPQSKPKPRLVMLSEDVLMKLANVSSLLNIEVLNIHGNSLSKVKELQSLPLLKKLVLSFNELTSLDDIGQLNLEYLDVSHNKITTLEGIKGLLKLRYLDLSWNHLCNTRDDISILRKHCPLLNDLDLRYNFWQKPESVRLRAIGRIKSLVRLNGENITEVEATAALRLAAGSRISQLSLLTHSRIDSQQPRSLSLDSWSKILCRMSRNKPQRTSDRDTQWYTKVTVLNLDSQHISKLSNLEKLENLRWASFCDNDITKIEGLENCLKLEELSLADNCISHIENLDQLSNLHHLSLGNNFIYTLEGTGLEKLNHLQYLSIESNNISSLYGLQRLIALTELYVGNNNVQNIREVFYLKNLQNLVILDLGGNPVAVTADNYRLFVIYHLKSLKALDGKAIESSEGGQAKEAFGGRLTQDFVAERLGYSNFYEVRELDFPQCGIRTVDLGSGTSFSQLRSVNLEHNNMTSFSGLIYLTNLRVLCLNHNHIDSIVARPKQQPPQMAAKNKSAAMQNNYSSVYSSPENLSPVLENLEVLHLGYNGIKDLVSLQLNRLPSLKALFLQGNEITKVEGLDALQDLRELVLDRNKIKSIGDYSFVNQWNLQELHLEENRLKDLSNLSCLENLQRLFLGMNRIQDLSELEKIESLRHLVELSVVSNAVARRMLHRPLLVYRMPNLMVIDGIPISEEERVKAEMYFIEQQPAPVTTTTDTTLPGIVQYKTQMPVKVTNMQLVSGPYYEKQWQGSLYLSDELLQQEVQKGAGRRRQQQQQQQTDSIQGVSAPVNTASKPGATLNYQATNNRPGGSNKHHTQLAQVPYVPHQNPSDTGKNNRR